ncbi:flavodoxin domain-containing protein [Scytonema sp. NUACC26]|uniref:flavodoxin domain-containing protein n=1 Tax=Scytonema sp. NUACC26 TaxID=3140176 RepID=UPI0034DB893B
MAEVLIVYISMFGNTQKLAQSIAEGAASVAGTTVTLRTAESATIDEVRQCDALILGSPVHMGMLDWRIKKFIDSSVYQLWLVDELVGKVAGVFATGGGYGNAGSGVELTQIAMLGSLAECGMILVPFPKSAPGSEVTGSRWGPYARSGGLRMEPDGITDAMLEGGHQYGASVARVAAALTGKELLPRGNHVPEGEILKAFQSVNG